MGNKSINVSLMCVCGTRGRDDGVAGGLANKGLTLVGADSTWILPKYKVYSRTEDLRGLTRKSLGPLQIGVGMRSRESGRQSFTDFA